MRAQVQGHLSATPATRHCLARFGHEMSSLHPGGVVGAAPQSSGGAPPSDLHSPSLLHHAITSIMPGAHESLRNAVAGVRPDR